MSSLVRSINNAVEQSLSVNGIKWRIEAWRTGIPYAEIVIKHALVYRVEQAFLIHAETGLLLEHVSAPDLDVPDADLISGMLAAIQDFVRDSFRPGEGGTLRTFSVGDHTVQVEAGPHALLALVIKGEAPPEVLLKQQNALETIHLEFATQLVDFSGEGAPFAAARPLLEDNLQTVLTTTQSSKKSCMWMRWGIPLLLLIVVVAVFWIRSTMRWNRALAALRAEPGYVVVDASRGWRKWNISGLKDPSAREPSAVISAAGLVPPKLSGQWQQYLSLDPGIVAARRQKWMALDSLRRTIESERVLFEAGSADVPPQAESRVRDVAKLITQLARGVAEFGGAISLELTGRTDPTGLDETNQTLSRRRAEQVSGILTSAGVPASLFSLSPIATARPLPSPDPQERARINRSVSFNVAVTVTPLPLGGQR
jgi:OOP family OmpA-OmpF porin